MASCFLSLTYLGNNQGFDGFLLLDADWDCGFGADCSAGVGPGLRCVLLCRHIMMKIKMLNSLKAEVL